MDGAIPARAGSRVGTWAARAAKAFAILCLVAGVWAHEYLKHYDPFVEGGGWGGPYTQTDIEIETLAGNQYFLRHDEGETFYTWTSLHNDSRWPVTIERIQTPDFGEIAATGVFVDPTWQEVGDDLQAFEPMRLEPGESAQLGVEMRFGPCRMRAGDSLGIDSLPMRYSLFGMTRHTVLDLGHFLIVRGYEGRVCADPDNPKLDIS